MYQIKCDDHILYDPRDEELILLNPKFHLEANTVGEGSFTILAKHPFYGALKKLRSRFELRQDNDIIFRGRMTNDSRDFYNRQFVDLEGVLAFTNDSIIEPYDFPKDDKFADAEASANIVEYFLQWAIDQHNSQVEEWQRLKLGRVTVSDPNNYITRSNTDYSTTMELLKSKLFESELGGYLCIRYEEDGNYVDYLKEFELTNTQRVTVTENMLDITQDSDASETYTAILPIGATVEGSEGERLTIESLPDGDLTDDVVKKGKYIYSKSGVAEHGWICMPPQESKWEDVTEPENLRDKALETLVGSAMLLSRTITIKAVDLSFSDSQIQSFRLYRNILVDVPSHGVENATFPLMKLDIEIMNPQNTIITIGDTVRTLIDVNNRNQSSTIERVEKTAQLTAGKTQEVMETVQQQMIVQETSMTATCSEMILAALDQYVETGVYNQFKETVEAQLAIMADEIVMNFTSTTESIDNVDGDLQARFTELYKYISFSESGITIGSGDSAITLEIDNDQITFKKNGVPFGWWDGNDFHTGNIVVEVNERAQFGNFAFVPRSDGSLMFLKVGG